MKWNSLRDATPVQNCEAIASLVQDDAKGQYLVEWDSNRLSSIWISMDRRLLSLSPAELAPLRQFQEAPAAGLIGATALGADPQPVLSAYRRYPWAAASHEALLRAGEIALRQGRWGWALRAFQDVFRHSADAGTRARARTGLWLALAQDPQNRPELGAALTGAVATASHPWMGRMESGARIQAQLLAPATRPPAPPGAPFARGIPQRILHEPLASPWPAIWTSGSLIGMLTNLPVLQGTVVERGGFVFLTGPALLACYGADSVEPRWVRTPSRPTAGGHGKTPEGFVAPGHYSPALSAGRLYTRWGVDPAGYYPVGIAAFDWETGAPLWSTLGDPAWAGLYAATDPVVADGRVYALAIRHGFLNAVSLLCLDADRGAMLWERELGARIADVPVAPGETIGGVRPNVIEYAHYSPPVTVWNGAVYCIPGIGFAARCDARDGLIEWIASYPRMEQVAQLARAARRLGAPPLVEGNAVVFMPRDARGMFALDAETGLPVWERRDPPYPDLLGRSAGIAVVRNTNRVEAINLTNGAALWEASATDLVASCAAFGGDAVGLGLRNRMVLLETRTGERLAESAWPGGVPLTRFTLSEAGMIGFTDLPAEPFVYTNLPAVAEDPDAFTLVAHRSEGPMILDGTMADYAAPSVIPLPGGARLAVEHDASALYLALSVPAKNTRASRGLDQYGGGDRLVIGINSRWTSYRWEIGIDSFGRAFARSATAALLPDGLRVAVNQDFVRDQLTYEARIPMEADMGNEEHRRVGLSLLSWSEVPGRGQQPRVAVGNGIVGTGIAAERHRPLYLHPASWSNEQAAMNIVRALPDLTESWAVFQEACRLRAWSSAQGPQPLYWDYLARSPASLWTETVMARLAASEPRGGDTWREGIAAAARNAGVPEAVRQRFERASAAYLSQWVLIEGTNPAPDGLMIELNGSECDCVWQRAYWGTFAGQSGRDCVGPLPPVGSWQELRVPLVRLDFCAKPIYGIAFKRAGGGKVVWDRTALVVGGQEYVLLDDELPPGHRRGRWEWVTTPVQSGTRAHVHSPAADVYPEADHLVYHLNFPETRHIAPPAERPYLSQWIFLDPARPPKMVSIALHDGTDWNSRLLWGEARQEGIVMGPLLHRPDWGWPCNGWPVQKGRYMGPLPKPGEWCELRVPLAWTCCLDSGIHGMLFEQIGGQVLWDRTALVTNGVESVLIEDDCPAGTAAAWRWTDNPVKSGARARVQESAGDYAAHGIYPLDQPVVGHLRPGPREIVAAVNRHLPALAEPQAARYRRRFDRLLGDFIQARSDRPLPVGSQEFKRRIRPDLPSGLAAVREALCAHPDFEGDDPLLAAERLVEKHALPPYALRRAYVSSAGGFQRAWQILGPLHYLAGGGFRDAIYAPEREGVDLARSFEGAAGPISWTNCTAKEDLVDILDLLSVRGVVNSFVYASCWVYSPREQKAVAELGCSTDCIVWVNRQPAVECARRGEPVARQYVGETVLRQGWNEVLLKLDGDLNRCRFCFALARPDGLGAVPDIRFSVTPPERGPTAGRSEGTGTARPE